MSRPQISHSQDLQRLRDEGYDIRIQSGYLLVCVPYVDATRQIRIGTLVTDLSLAGNVTTTPTQHIAWFAGEHPCDKHGREIEQIRHAASQQTLAPGVSVDRSFSNKPSAGYRDYYEKVSTYAAIIGHPAESLDRSIKIRTFRASASDGDDESVFAYLDTASTKAGIASITAMMAGKRLGIVGLGGTGSYVLDLVAKCPVAEIHIFDGDHLLQHNAFRSPGAPSDADLQKAPMKVDWFAEIYARMHRGIRKHAYYMHEGNVAELQHLDFVFLCIDRNDVRKIIVRELMAASVRFVDAGMGVQVDDSRQLGGILRVTTVTPDKLEHVAKRIPLAQGDDDGLYASNIQIADLNCLTATLAVIKWKKLMGVYRDYEREHHATYTIDGNMLLSEEKACE